MLPKVKNHRFVAHLLAFGLAAALGLGACGGDDEAPSAANSKSAESTREGGKSGGSSEKDGTVRARDSGGSDGDGAEPASGSSEKSSKTTRSKRRELTRAEALRRLPRKHRARYVKRFAKIIVAASDLGGGKVDVSYGGVAVRVALPAKVACRAEPNEGDRILRALKKVVPYPRSVTVSVAGSSQPLPTYLASTCKESELPGGQGRTVLRLSGSGVQQTKQFTIRSKRWTIEYVSKGSFFSIFARKGRRPQRAVTSEETSQSGKETYRGPGKFTLQIAGTRPWTVRVRDGG